MLHIPALEQIGHNKQQAAEKAVEFVRSGMVVGLGTGSTAIHATRRIGQLLREGQLHDLIGVPTSSATAAAARELGIRLLREDIPRQIDVTIDGADEVDPQLELIKGGGGALLREKIVAQASHRRVIVIDDTKLSPVLGTRHSVPVELLPFGWRRQAAYLVSLGARVTLRLDYDGAPFKTDQGNLIVDCAFGPIAQPADLATSIRARAGIVEHGLFVRMTSDLIVGGADGTRHVTGRM